MGFNSSNTYGISSWDLFFFDTNGRDAAFRELVSGNPPLSAWWTNADLNNLRIWADQLNKSTSLRSMYWQIALGNQKYKTIDNTSGHYEDRISEYLLENQSSDRLSKWAQSGVIGLLFGSGNANTTNNWDYKVDGVTNGASSGITATVSDDDGGFFRYKASEYYSNGKISLEETIFSDNQIVISFNANATDASDVVAELHSSVNIDNYSTTYYKQTGNEVFLTTQGVNFVNTNGILPDLILAKTSGMSSGNKYTVVSKRFPVSDYLYTKPFNVVSTDNIKRNAVLNVRYDDVINRREGSVIKLIPVGVAENPDDQILDASFNIYTKLDDNNSSGQILDLYEIDYTDWDSNIEDNINDGSNQYDILNSKIQDVIEESSLSSSSIGINSPTTNDLDLNTFSINDLTNVNGEITLALTKTKIRGEGRFKFYSGQEESTSPYALFSYITFDETPPTVTLSDDDFDNFVSGSETVTITATFSERMSSAPTISFSGIASDITMSQTGSETVWSYTWDVPEDFSISTEVTISGEDLSGNSYQGNDSIIFKNSSGGIYYVDPTNGNDTTADGSKLLPFENIEVAADLAVINNIYKIQIVEGTHEMTNPQNISVQSPQELIIEAETGKIVTLSGNGYLNMISIKNPNVSLTEEGDYSNSPTNITIRNLIFEGNADYYDHYEIISEHYFNQNNTFNENRGNGTAINISHGIDIKIENNTISNFYQKGIEIKWGRYVTVKDNIINKIAFTSLSGGAGIHRNWNYESGFNDSDDPTKYRVDISNNLLFNIYQRIYSWVPNKGFLNMEIDEGKSIWLDGYPYDDHLVHKMKMRLDNNFVAITETDAITMKPHQGLEVTNNSIYVNSSGADGFVDRPHRYGIADNETYPGLIFENNLIQTKTLNDEGNSVYAVSFNRVYDSYLNGIVSSVNSNYYFGGTLRPSEMGFGFTELTSSPYQDPENGDFTYSNTVPNGVGENLDNLQPLFIRANNLNISLQGLNWEYNHIKSTQTILDNIPGIYDDIDGNETVFLGVGTYFHSDKEGERGRYSWYLKPNFNWETWVNDYADTNLINEHFDRPRYSTDNTLNWDQFDGYYEFILHKEYTDWYNTIRENYTNTNGNDYTYIRNGESVIKQDFNIPSYGLTVFEIEDNNTYDITESTHNIELDGDLLIRVNPNVTSGIFDLIPSTANITSNQDSLFNIINVEGFSGDYSLEIINTQSSKVLRLTLGQEEVDTTVPIITLIGESTIDIEVGSTYTDQGATASDNYDGDITSSIVTVNPVDTDVVGQYTVTYNVTDTSSNAAVEVTRTVNVVESLSIDDNDEIKLSIFPNPTSTSWYIKTKTIINSILLYDILGRKVYHDTPNNKNVEIDAKFLPNGFYLLVINKAESFRLIKK